tara:strand:- start:1097 stop:1717 length:621 start_codon:yes stop_codon:yes gene_type:complete
MKYTLPKDASELTKLITTAIKSAQTMRVKVQQAAIGILYHAHKCGDWTAANDLVDGLGHGVKRDSLVEFFVVFGGLEVNEEAKAFAGWAGREHIQDNFDAAKDMMWWDFKKANPFKGFNAQAEMDKMLKRMRDMQGVSDTDEDKAEKIDLNVSEASIEAFLALTGKGAAIKVLLDGIDFDAIIDGQPEPVNDELQDDLVAELVKAG